MKYFQWGLQIVLALMLGAAGAMKVVTPRDQLATQMAWANDFSATQITLIGAAEVAGAIGLVVPAATGILPVLTPVAAGCLAFLMGGAVATHVRRGEPFGVPLMLALACLAVAVLAVRGRTPTVRR
jgi:hypothetical protein